ncbi:hypothetical protein BJF90_41720 [Pseudonocardia sp. CNS-004]|nr:hypothetical protein BJF90_41720 [Pseudonocardia sp. CNS-004]
MSALATTVERLRGLRPAYPDVYAPRIGVPAEPGWRSFADLEPHVGQLCAQAREEDNPGRLASVAAAAVGGTLSHAVLGRVTAALVLERRAWTVAAGHLAVHGDDDQVALRDTSVLVLPDDPAAGHPDAEVVPDLPTLLDRVAADAVATLRPLLDAVRAATRYGLVPLWNGAADAVRGAAHYAPLYAGATGSGHTRWAPPSSTRWPRTARACAGGEGPRSWSGVPRPTGCRCGPPAASTTGPTRRWSGRPTRTA